MDKKPKEKTENEHYYKEDEGIEFETDQKDEKKVDDVSDDLTSKNLAAKVEKLIDEKIELARQAQDNETDKQDEEEKEEPKGFGMFPALLIGGIVLVGAATLFLKNRPNSHPIEAETENQG